MYRKASLLLLFFFIISCFTNQAMAGGFQQTQWRKYNTVVQATSRHYQIDPRLIHAVIWQESNYNRQAISSAGALGLMQLMPGTAKDLGVQKPFSSLQNIDGGTRYLIQNLRRFGSLKKALQAYHCGPNCVASGRVPSISFHYANQVIARFRYLKNLYPTKIQ